jgi:hypothetical protein
MLKPLVLLTAAMTSLAKQTGSSTPRRPRRTTRKSVVEYPYYLSGWTAAAVTTLYAAFLLAIRLGVLLASSLFRIPREQYPQLLP